ncbi:SDR family oxidoreductase [Rhodococcus sp. Z13]|uniref:SDR family oxidoreductase n=1 Tax=Rhodococcus sacchari TaxID=2962047 RepID=A0ACD4DJB6_9NOCA|nr:SDR family oxidoreductase [Rhodococcus sp. Z13]UYP20136.1 SDR family oxidoreductase [Rhodococcus sp. Z13]
MARIALFGGHGKVALHLERLLAEAGHETSAFIRNPDHADDVREAGATPVVADVEKLGLAELTDLVKGHDAVVWSAGAGGGDPQRTYAVDRDAAIASMTAAQQAGVRRYVMVSYYGSRPDHGVPEDNSFHAYAEAKAAADTHLRGTDLDWTILGPSALTLDPPTGRIEIEGHGAQDKGKVSRADVAAVVAAVLERPGTAGRTIEFNNGDTPITEALDGLG